MWQFFSNIQYPRPTHTRVRVRKIGKTSSDQLGSLGMVRIPDVINGMEQLRQDSSARPEDYATFFALDKAHSSRLIRLANSAYFCDNPVGFSASLAFAVKEVGFERTSELAHTLSLRHLFEHESLVGTYSTERLWTHSLGTAFATRHIFESKFGSDPSVDPFLAGIIHNLGIVAEHTFLFNQGFSEAVTAQVLNGTSLIDEERKQFGATHEEIGCEIARNWGLSPDIQTLLGHHHHRVHHKHDKSATTRLLHALKVADWMCFESGIGYADISSSLSEEYAASRKELDIQDEEYSELCQTVSEELNQFRRICHV